MYDDDRPVARLEPAQLSVSAPLSLPGSASMARSMKARRHGALPAYRALSYPLYSFILYTHTHSEDTFQPPQSRLYRSITSLAGCLLGFFIRPALCWLLARTKTSAHTLITPIGNDRCWRSSCCSDWCCCCCCCCWCWCVYAAAAPAIVLAS